jgi:glycosyltransferase involved in cell wall biosynthesis
MVKLSIITPTFNRYNQLQNNIKSVSSQSFKEIEHIIVDNMSNDGTDELVIKYQDDAVYPVIYIREPDKGIYEAMNKGLKKASGEWVHILNSDDVYHSFSTLENLFSINYQDFDIIVNPIIVKNEGSNEYFWTPTYNEKIRHYRFPHTGLIIQNEFYNRFGYYNEKYKIISDAIFINKNLPRAKYIILNEPLIIMSNNGISSNLSSLYYYERFLAITFYHNFPILFKIKEMLKCIAEFLEFKIKKKIGK